MPPPRAGRRRDPGRSAARLAPPRRQRHAHAPRSWDRPSEEDIRVGRVKLAQCAGLALAVVVGFAALRLAVGADDDLDAVTKQCKAFKAGWNSHDPKAMAAVFAEDADAIDPMGRKAVGRAAVERA